MIGFRLDANKYVAMGHMMRCITIANACRKIGLECIFFVSDEENVSVIENAGFEYRVLNTRWNDWSQGVDDLEAVIKEYKIELLVVDSYYVTNQFFININKCVPVFYIDDLCTEAFDVNVVMHYSQWTEETTLQDVYNEKDAKLLYGMQYMPLRSEFRVDKNVKKKNQIMITTGGTDPLHITVEVAKKIIESNELQDMRCVAILGKMNMDLDCLLDISRKSERLEVLYDISNMGQVMNESDLAISAGGCTIYELCACQIPTVAFSFSNDQVSFCEKMEQHNILEYAGDARTDDNITEEIVRKIEKLYNDVERQKLYQQNMASVTDGKGADRIARYIANFV